MRTISDTWALHHSVTGDSEAHLAQGHVVRGCIITVYIVEQLPLNIYYQRAGTKTEKLWMCPLVS